MGLTIRNLLALQEVDLQIISLNDEKGKLLHVINEKKSELDESRGEFEEREGQIKRLKVDIKNLEVELAETGDRIKKLEGQQIHVKTNQEYKALDKEIYDAKAHQARTEDFLLQKMELLEQETAGIRDARQQLDEQASQLKVETSTAEERLREIEGGIAELRSKRSQMASTIEDGHLRLYNRIFNSKRVPAIVPLVNRACQGCHLAVPAGIESILRRHESNIITCENCSRILYVAEEEDLD